MAVTLRGYTQGAFSSTGAHTVAWPSGTVAGDLAVILCAPGKDKKPTTVLPAGWQQKGVKSDGTAVYAKMLTSADIASALSVTARVQLLQVFAGAGGVGAVGASESLAVTTAGGALLLLGWKTTTDTLTASAKIHATDVANDSYVTDGTSRKYNGWYSAMASAGTAYIDTNAAAFFAVELLAQTDPYAPTPTEPADGAFHDFGTGIRLKVTHNSASNGTASGYCVQVRRVGTTPWYYVQLDAGDNTILAASYIVVVPFYGLVPTSGLTNGSEYEWQASTTEDGTTGGLGPFSELRTFNLRTKPTLTASTSGSGIAHTASWAATITNGVQTAYRVRVCASADSTANNPIADSGWLAGSSTSYAIPADTDYTNGATYKAWVEVQQTGGQVTVPTASASYTASWTTPTRPSSVTVTAGTPTTITVAGLTIGRRIRVTYTAAGVTQTVYRTVTATSEVVDVPLAPYGIATTYTAVQSNTISGVEKWSTDRTGSGTATDRGAYLVSADGTDYLAVHPAKMSEPEDTEGVLVSYGLGATVPTVTYTPSAGKRGEESVLVETQAEKDALLAWLDANRTFTYRYPPERDGSTYTDVPPRLMARVTPRQESRLVQRDVQLRTVTWAWVEQ